MGNIITYREIRDAILAAIDANLCTFAAMKASVEREREAEIISYDFNSAINSMAASGEIVGLSNSTIVAYFRAGDSITAPLPTRFFLRGGGVVIPHYEGENTLLPVVPQDGELDILPDDFEISVSPFFTDQDYATITDAAAAKLSDDEIAERLKISPTVWAQRKRSDKRTKDAVYRGSSLAEVTAQIKDVQAMAAEGKSDGEIARFLKLTPKTFNERVSEFPAFKEALETGKAEHARTLPPPELEISDKEKFFEQRKTQSGATESIPIQTISELDKDNEAAAPRRVAIRTRVCSCGNRLGARKNECRDCWLRFKNKAIANPDDPKFARASKKLRGILTKVEFDKGELLAISIETILASGSASLKEAFTERLLLVALDQLHGSSSENYQKTVLDLENLLKEE